MGYFIEDHIGFFDEQPRISDQINRAGPLGCFFRLKKKREEKGQSRGSRGSPQALAWNNLMPCTPQEKSKFLKAEELAEKKDAILSKCSYCSLLV